jgi:SAM-dependent methyltransferase
MSASWRPSADARRRLRQRVTRVLRPAWLGTLRRTTPLSNKWGYDRGRPVDRYYIEAFLERHRADIRGHVLEVKDRTYTDRFGLGVTESDVLDINPRNPHATIIADLGAPDFLGADSFDCCIVTQTLQYIYDTRAAVTQLKRLLRPGGVLLTTVPALSRLDKPDNCGPDLWRFTPASCTRVFADVFGPRQVTVRAHGNVLASIASLTGMAEEELSRREIDVHDPLFPVVITVRAVKDGESPVTSPGSA